MLFGPRIFCVNRACLFHRCGKCTRKDLIINADGTCLSYLENKGVVLSYEDTL